MADTMFVKSGLPGERVALWERDPAHPGGEVFVAGDKVVEVGKSAEVMRLIRSGALVEAERPSKEDRAEAERIVETIEDAAPAEEVAEAPIRIAPALPPTRRGR